MGWRLRLLWQLILRQLHQLYPPQKQGPAHHNAMQEQQPLVHLRALSHLPIVRPLHFPLLRGLPTFVVLRVRPPPLLPCGLPLLCYCGSPRSVSYPPAISSGSLPLRFGADPPHSSGRRQLTPCCWRAVSFGLGAAASSILE